MATLGNNGQAVICGTLGCAVDALGNDDIDLNTNALSVNMPAAPIRGQTAGSLAVSLFQLIDGNVAGAGTVGARDPKARARSFPARD
ncbi:MAG: hypothetical protein MZV65_54120 [Chromatiales bacterium]|nr:hypothetical protein [Chromatiales bacterium]